MSTEVDNFNIKFNIEYDKRKAKDAKDGLDDIKKSSKGAKDGLDGVKKGSDNANKGISGFTDTVRSNTSSAMKNTAVLAAVAASMYAVKKASDAVIKVGFDYNVQMDAAKSKLTAVISGTRGYTDTTGKDVDAKKRQILINEEVIDTLEKLKIANFNTTMGMADLTKVYAAMKFGVEANNWSMKDQIEVLQLLTNSASAFGVEASALLSGVDQLGSGKWASDSDFGLMMNSLGIVRIEYEKTNDKLSMIKEALKETGKMQDNWAAAVSRFNNKWNDLTGKVTKPLFDIAQKSLVRFESGLNEINGDQIDSLSKSVVTLTKEILITMANVTLGLMIFKQGMDGITYAVKASLNGLKIAFYDFTSDIERNFKKLQEYSIKFRGFLDKNDDEVASALKKLYESETPETDNFNNALKESRKFNDEYLKSIERSTGAINMLYEAKEMGIEIINDSIEELELEKDVKTELMSVDEAWLDVQKSVAGIKLSNSTAAKKKLKDEAEAAKKASLAYAVLERQLSSVYKFLGNDKKALTIDISIRKKELKKDGVSTEDINAVARKMQEDFDAEQVQKAKNKADKELQIHKNLVNSKLNLERIYINSVGTEKQKFEQELVDKRRELVALKMDESKIEEILGKMVQDKNEKARQTNDQLGLYIEKLREDSTNYGDMSLQLIESLNSTLNNSFNKFFDSSAKGFMNMKVLFQDVTKSILQEIQKIIIKKMVAAAISMGSSAFGFKNGGAVPEVSKYKNGGTLLNSVVSKPTKFDNGAGLLGEHGAEAIMPLKRSRNGALGVEVNGGSKSAQAQIVINNYNGSKITTKVEDNGKTTLNIEDVVGELNSQIGSKSGDFYHQMSNSFREN